MSTSRSSITSIWAWLLAALAVAGLLGYGYYLQYVEYLDPCPLCITQRMFYMLVAAAAIVALIGFKFVRLQQFMAVLLGLSAIGGLSTAGRQVWLQHLPKDQVPECGLGLQYWLENEPFFNTVALLFKGDGNCAEVQWRFLGLSIAEWSLAWFVGFLLLAIVLFVRLGREAKANKTLARRAAYDSNS